MLPSTTPHLSTQSNTSDSIPRKFAYLQAINFSSWAPNDVRDANMPVSTGVLPLTVRARKPITTYKFIKIENPHTNSDLVFLHMEKCWAMDASWCSKLPWRCKNVQFSPNYNHLLIFYLMKPPESVKIQKPHAFVGEHHSSSFYGELSIIRTNRERPSFNSARSFHRVTESNLHASRGQSCPRSNPFFVLGYISTFTGSTHSIQADDMSSVAASHTTEPPVRSSTQEQDITLDSDTENFESSGGHGTRAI